ncbi:Sphingosine kinase 1, partial [Mucuna pruriens]
MDHQRPLMSDRVTVNGIVTPLALLANGRLWWSEGIQRCLSVEKDVLGFVTSGPYIKIKSLVEIRDGCCVTGAPARLVRNDVVFMPSSEESHRLWCQKLREFMDSLGRPKRLFVFVNPFGGKKSATEIFAYQVKPLLEDAQIEITVQETNHQLHAKEVAHSLDITKYDGIVCVSGDGILVEVVNGLLQREDWDVAIKMPLGVVPAGTGNGMAKSLLDSIGEPCAVAHAVLAIIRGHKQPLDVATITQGETRFFSILMLAWGLVADIDIESEKYRWMGSARLDFYVSIPFYNLHSMFSFTYGLCRLLNLRQYFGCVSFVPAPGYEAFGEPTSYPGKPTTSKGSNSDPSEAEHANLQRHCYLGPEINLENLNWRVINGPFISVWLHNVPWGAEDTMAAPDAKFSDGYLDLIITKNCPMLPLLSMMSELNKGGHVKSPYVMYLKVKAFSLEPGPRTKDQEKEGIIDSDGEVLARGKGTYKCEQKALMVYDKLQITVDQGLATLFTPTNTNTRSSWDMLFTSFKDV